ncbi:MAG: helix-turn-helix transcriptional regulator [Planctomycetes bacterium]|nr:helix-turn-helix transcriptional regulator [Planctomycetota bacterium]
MGKKTDQIINEFEAELKAGKKPRIRDFQKRYGNRIDPATMGTLFMIQALYDNKDSMKLPEGFAEKQRQLAQSLVKGKHHNPTCRTMRIMDVPPPLTKEKGGVPVVTLAAAGKSEIYEAGVTMTEDGWEKITRPYDLPHKEVFAVEVKGDSLEPLIPAGSRAVVDTRKEAHSNSLAVVIMNDYRACIKKIKFRGDRVMLISSNPEYPPREVDKKDIWKIYPVVWIRFK